MFGDSRGELMWKQLDEHVIAVCCLSDELSHFLALFLHYQLHDGDFEFEETFIFACPLQTSEDHLQEVEQV